MYYEYRRIVLEDEVCLIIETADFVLVQNRLIPSHISEYSM